MRIYKTAQELAYYEQKLGSAHEISNGLAEYIVKPSTKLVDALSQIEDITKEIHEDARAVSKLKNLGSV